jgi:hypothetical protein
MALSTDWVAAMQAAWRKKYAGKGGSDVAPAVGSTPAQNQAAAPQPRRTVSQRAVNPDPHRNESETEAQRIQRINRERRAANARRNQASRGGN